MSSFSWFSLLLLLAMAYLGRRIGWLSQIIAYATFGLFISASLLLFDNVQTLYLPYLRYSVVILARHFTWTAALLSLSPVLRHC